MTRDLTETLRSDRTRARAYAERAGAARVKRLLLAARDDLARRLRAYPPSAETFTEARSRATLAQIEQALKALKDGMRSDLIDQASEAAEAQAEGMLRYLRDAEARYQGIVAPLPFDEAEMLDESVRGAEASVLRRIDGDPRHPGPPGVIERYGEATIGAFEQELRVSLLARRSWEETRAAIVDRSPFLQGAPAHWAERIVRTELANASNAAAQATIAGAAKAFDDMAKILAATFDARTASDSFACHGQIRRPSEPFDTWQGKVMHPPARPNDREVVVPHRLAWPIPPELAPRSAGDVLARWRAEGRKGSPPPRPRLSTIPAKELASAKVPRLGSVDDEELDYLRDEDSFRPESFADARRRMADRRAEGATATEAALALPPVRIEIDASGQKTLADGRHRWAVAREQRAAAIRARVVRYGPRGAVRSDRVEAVRIRT